MMKFLQNLQKSIKAHHLLFLGLVVAVVALAIYSSHKSKIMDLMTTNNKENEAKRLSMPYKPTIMFILQLL